MLLQVKDLEGLKQITTFVSVMKKFLSLVTVLSALLSCEKEAEIQYDVVVYGGNASAVMATCAASRSGAHVIMVSPDRHVGGMVSGGLGYTDIGNKQVVKGLARDFFRKVGKHYGRFEQWVFEPHVAENILEGYVKGCPRMMGWRLDSLSKEGTTIKNIMVTDGTAARTISAKVFIDCTYEGDLMAAAGVSYTVGREDNAVYGETWNGCHMMETHQFPDGVDPYVVPGDPTSGFLWGISDQKMTPEGKGDTLVQAYNYRLCLTDSLENMVPITKPSDYDPSKYELMLRLMLAQKDKRALNDYLIISSMPGRKTDINNRGAFSTDMIGWSNNYPEASFEERQKIIAAHKSYTQGMLYFLGHDERVPDQIRKEMLSWGYPKDEYRDNGHFTPQLYIRESRRMIGPYVATQADCEGRSVPGDAIGWAAYTMDSHNCRRIVIEKSGVPMVKNEGDVEIPGGGPYPISYRSITPKGTECSNLLVPVCLSASHIAYGSIRMEPVFMVLGQSAGVAAAMAAKGSISVQAVPSAKIRGIYDTDPLLDGSAPDILYDEDTPAVKTEGSWERKASRSAYGSTAWVLPATRYGWLHYVTEPLTGSYDVYTYERVGKNASPSKTYVLSYGDVSEKIQFEAANLPVIGQTSGEWFHLGRVNLTEESLTVKMTPGQSEMDTYSDALLLVSFCITK